MGIIIEFLILLGLIKYLYGQEMADSCLGSCISDIIVAVIAVVGYYLIDAYAPGMFPIVAYILGGIIVLCIIWIVYNLLCAAFNWNN